MPKSFVYGQGNYFASHHGNPSPWQWVFWGATAGVVIGTGISLSIGLFYSASGNTTCAVILLSGVAGGILGHVMCHLLTDRELSFLGRAVGGEQHFIADDPSQIIDLVDHRALKGERLLQKAGSSQEGSGEGGGNRRPAP